MPLGAWVPLSGVVAAADGGLPARPVPGAPLSACRPCSGRRS